MNYFSQWPELEFIRQDETRVKASEALKGKEYVIFFVGAPWHKNYVEFIPTMKTFYDTFHEKKNFEVILLTRGDTEEEILTDFFSPAYGQSTFSLPCSGEMLAARERRNRQMKALAEKQAKKTDLPGKGEDSLPAAASSSSSTAAASSLTEKANDGATPPKDGPPQKAAKDGLAAEGEVRQRKYGPGSAISAALKDASPSPTHATRPSAKGAVISVPRCGKHGDYLLLDPAHSEVVGTPLLFFFRVFSYPGVIICRVGEPVVGPPLLKNVQPLPPPRATPWTPAVVRPPFERDASGRRKYTPFIHDKRCQPDLCSMAGKWMIEKKDPNAENFPWDSFYLSKTPLYFVLWVMFATVIACIFAVILAKSPDLRMQVNTFFGYPLLAVPEPA